jgi:hypothetical protein
MNQASQDWQESLREWCRRMEDYAEGRASLSNLLYDAQEERIPKPVLRAFLEDVATRWEAETRESMRKYRVQKHPAEVFKEAVQANAKTYLCQGEEALSKVPEQYSRVMTVRDFVAFNLNLEQVPYAITGSLTSDQVRYMEEQGLEGKTKGKIRGALPFAWVTKTESLATVRETHYPSDAARKNLGLSRFTEDEYLVEIKYPEAKPIGTKLSAPTSLEGCPSLVFRSRLGDDGWGYAVNLETLDDGFPEAIHWEVDFTDDFKVADLGRLPPLRPGFDWEVFLDGLPRPWTSELWEELVQYVQ